MTKWPSCLFLNTWKFLHVPKAQLEASPWPPRQGSVHPNWGNDITEFLWTWITNCLKEVFVHEEQRTHSKYAVIYTAPFPSCTAQYSIDFHGFVPVSCQKIFMEKILHPYGTAHALRHIVPYTHWFFSEVTMEVKNTYANQISIWTIIIALGLK